MHPTLAAFAASYRHRYPDLEATIEATHKVLDGAGVTWSLGNEATRLPLAKRAEFAAEPDTLPNTEREALTERATKAEAEVARMRGGDRDLAAKDKSLTTANAALTRICEVIGAPAPCVAEDAVEAVKTLLGAGRYSEERAVKAERTLREIKQALADAGAPQAYHLEDGTERPIPDPERIRLLGERVHTLRAQVREVTDATNYLDAIVEGHNALDDRNAPRLADGHVLSLAARIRSLPR